MDANSGRSVWSNRAWAAARLGGAAGGAAALGAGAVWVGGAAYFARRVVTPDRRKPNDQEIRAVRVGEIDLAITPDSTVPGRYGLWIGTGDDTHVRIGDVLSVDEAAGTVTRELIGVDFGELVVGPARWDQYFFGETPQRSLGLPTTDVLVRSDIGDLPAWLVPAAGESTRWAITVHGRGARRLEGLRAVPTLHAAGYTTLVPAYRNDEEAPPGPDGRYNLGLSEWRDIEAAMRFAIDHGAREIDLVGWSMGGAIILQLLDRSELAGRVTKIVLDGPVVSWSEVLLHHARLNRVPRPIGRLGTSLLGRRSARRFVGVHEPIDVAVTDWVNRAEELRTPMLLIHSRDDEFVPVESSRALAAARPDLIRYEEWEHARHCKEWNVDPERWERVVREFIS